MFILEIYQHVIHMLFMKHFKITALMIWQNVSVDMFQMDLMDIFVWITFLQWREKKTRIRDMKLWGDYMRLVI